MSKFVPREHLDPVLIEALTAAFKDRPDYLDSIEKGLKGDGNLFRILDDFYGSSDLTFTQRKLCKRTTNALEGPYYEANTPSSVVAEATEAQRQNAARLER